jgi:DNA-binding phage protein
MASLSFSAISEYERDFNTSAFMLMLRLIVEAQGGIPQLSELSHLNRQNLYKILTSKTTLRFDTMVSIIKGLGYHLVPQNVENFSTNQLHIS